MSKILTLNSEQQAYLTEKLGKDLAQQFITAGTVGLHGIMRPMVEPKLGAADWAAMIQHAERENGGTTGFPTSGVVSGLMVTGIHAASTKIASALTQRDRAGNEIPGRKHPGIAREYLDGKYAWPTVDAFGRAFPTPEALAGLPKQEMGKKLTASGFPKCHMDGLLYYQQRNGGSENVLHGDTIAEGGWRGYNQQRGTGARYWAPERHATVAPLMLGDAPKEYNALIESLKAARAASAAAPSLPGTTAPKRTRRKTQV